MGCWQKISFCFLTKIQRGIKISSEIKKWGLAVVYRDLEVLLLFCLKSMRCLSEFRGNKTGGSGTAFAYSWLQVRTWTWVQVCSLNVKTVSLHWINTICNSLRRCARGFAAFTICHINPHPSVNVWRGCFRGPLGENRNEISRANATKMNYFST